MDFFLLLHAIVWIQNLGFNHFLSILFTSTLYYQPVWDTLLVSFVTRVQYSGRWIVLVWFSVTSHLTASSCRTNFMWVCFLSYNFLLLFPTRVDGITGWSHFAAWKWEWITTTHAGFCKWPKLCWDSYTGWGKAQKSPPGCGSAFPPALSALLQCPSRLPETAALALSAVWSHALNWRKEERTKNELPINEGTAGWLKPDKQRSEHKHMDLP